MVIPVAMEHKIEAANSDLANDDCKYPSKRSITLLISGTPGTKYNTAVAIAICDVSPFPNSVFVPDIKVVTIDAKIKDRNELNFFRNIK